MLAKESSVFYEPQKHKKEPRKIMVGRGEITYLERKIKNQRQNQNSKQRRQRTTRNKCEGANLWVVRARIDPNGTACLKDSRPCGECLAACIKVGINRIFYSNSDGSITCEYVKDMISTHISYFQSRNIDVLNHNWRF